MYFGFLINFILNSKYLPPQKNIIQMKCMLPKFKYVPVFYSWPLCTLLCSYLQGSFHIRLQSQKLLIAVVFLIIIRNTLFDYRFYAGPNIQSVSILNVTFSGKISYRKHILLLLLRSTKHGYN